MRRRCSISWLDFAPCSTAILVPLEDALGATVSVAQTKSRFAALVARAEAGETIVVTRDGRAVACLGRFRGGSRASESRFIPRPARRRRATERRRGGGGGF